MIGDKIREIAKSLDGLVDSITLTEEGWELLQREVLLCEQETMGHPFGLASTQYKTVYVYKKEK